MQKLSLIILLFLSSAAIAQMKQLTLQDAILGRDTYLAHETLKNIAWKNEDGFSYVKNDTLWSEDVKSENKKMVLTRQKLSSILRREGNGEIRKLPGYSWTPGGEILLKHMQSWYILDPIEEKIELKIDIPPKAENDLFSVLGSYVVYTVENDLYISFSDGKTVQITHDGGNGIVNGKTVHRSEFGITRGIFISPQGTRIAFYRKDESMVTDYPLVDYMSRIAGHTPVKYPMAGMKSHEVTVGIYEPATNRIIYLKTGGDPEHFLTNLSWSPDEKHLYIAELNRGQDHMQLNSYDVVTGARVNTILEERSEKYIEPQHALLFSKVNKDEFFHLSRRDGMLHVYQWNTNGTLKQRITHGDWEVSKILGFDDKEKNMFIEAYKESPLEKHLYRVDLKTKIIEKISTEPGIHEGWLSPGGKNLIDSYTAPEIPAQTELFTANGKQIRTVHAAEDPLKSYQLGEVRLVSIPSADGNSQLSGRLILPVNFDPMKKYPVIIYVYGGPHSQMVDMSWNYGTRWWQYYMASQGYISFTMDNRGTSNRGFTFESAIHRQLGIPETADQMEGVKYLKSLPYTDPERFGVHGWSYGGFMTLNLMLRNPGSFKAGVAGGPVVDWSLYEVMYGERYMDHPDENPVGYKETNMVNHVKNLTGKLMLIHGAQDETVVLQHSMMFLRECVKQGKPVDFFTYPTHPHNVRGVDRVHLMEKVSRYFFENL